MNKMQYGRTGNNGIQITYYGNAKELKKLAIRIQNACERLEGNENE